jgi:hypothetical protein
MSADHVGPVSLGFAHMPWFKPLCLSCNSSKGNRLTHLDVKALVAREKSGERVVSLQIQALWDACKNRVDSDATATKLSKLLRINQHYYLLLLKELYDTKHPEVLLPLLGVELAEEKVEFEGLDTTNYTFKSIKRTRRADTYSQSKAARMVRIAFDSLDDYSSKEKRNIHEVSPEIEQPLRLAVHEAVKLELSAEIKSDALMGAKLFAALRNNLGAEERAALAEKVFDKKYKPANSFSESRVAIKQYVDGIGIFLASNKF